MVFERSPYMALLCVLALLLFAPPCQADSVHIHHLSEKLPGKVPAVFADDNLVDPVDVQLPPEDLPDLVPVVSMNDSPAMDASATVEPVDSLNASSEAIYAPIQYVQAEAGPAMPPEHVIRGTIYSVSSGGRRPWADEHLRVYVNGIRAVMNGPTYFVVLLAPADGDPVEVALEHDCGYLLGRSTGYVDLSEGSTSIDVEAPALEISGDVYIDNLPADGACLFVYLNDRPFGPIEATSGQGPMFSVSIPGGHPGDRVSITASRGDRSGIVSQDMSGYYAFLTVNLKGTATYLPYTDSAMPFRPAKNNEKSSSLEIRLLRLQYDDRRPG